MMSNDEFVGWVKGFVVDGGKETLTKADVDLLKAKLPDGTANQNKQAAKSAPKRKR